MSIILSSNFLPPSQDFFVAKNKIETDNKNIMKSDTIDKSFEKIFSSVDTISKEVADRIRYVGVRNVLKHVNNRTVSKILKNEPDINVNILKEVWDTIKDMPKSETSKHTPNLYR